MCGRYVNSLDIDEVLEAFAAIKESYDARRTPPSYNIAPTQLAPVVVGPLDTAPERRLVTARWGLVPSWAKDPSIGNRLFNARSETAAEKPSFRSAFAKRRCLVPANGYYEWQKRETGKQPYFIHPADDGVLAFAGLWETWGRGEERVVSFSILTTAARGDLARIHDRQPVMLRPDERDAWMDADATRDDLLAVIASPEPAMAARPVGAAVGNVRNNGPALVEEVADPGGA
jgi:putative SOS response-associated peptidase YedK